MDELVVINKNAKCNFCGVKKNDHLMYGPIYKLENIKAHYYCVLLSNRLIQNGNDDEGILGFLLSDILNELKRTADIMCVYCNRGNATIKCAASKCRKSFHLPCGLESGSLHQFTHQFKSFCHSHRPVQNIPSKILKEACKTRVICCICFDNINVKNRKDNLWAPCCLKTWYHRFCVQKLALSSGYFFKCATCNNVQKFSKWMQRFGIFVPQQDASWELVPHAYEDLLFRYNKCDAEKCKCPQGRNENTENTIWEIVLCESCGSQGIHVACGNLKFVDPEWECSGCQKVSDKVKATTKTNSDSAKVDEGSSKTLKLTEINQKKRRRDSDDMENSVLDKRKKTRLNCEEIEQEGENEVDVETVDEEPKTKDGTRAENIDCPEEPKDMKPEEAKHKQKADLQEMLSLLKPGPLSYKLGLIQTCGNMIEKLNSKATQPVIDLIELSDSDEEMDSAEDDDIQVIRDFSVEMPEKDPDLIFCARINKASGTREEFGEKYSTEIAREPEMQTLLDVDFAAVCATKIQAVEKPLYSVDQSTIPVRILGEETSCNNQEPQNYVLSSERPFEWRHGEEGSIFSNIFLLHNSFEKKKKKKEKDEDEEIVEVCDDEVIVLSN